MSQKKDLLNLFLSISAFIAAISTLVEYKRYFVSRPDLFCNRKNYLIKHFIFSLAESKTGCSKIGSIFFLTFR